MGGCRNPHARCKSEAVAVNHMKFLAPQLKLDQHYVIECTDVLEDNHQMLVAGKGSAGAL